MKTKILKSLGGDIDAGCIIEVSPQVASLLLEKNSLTQKYIEEIYVNDKEPKDVKEISSRIHVLSTRLNVLNVSKQIKRTEWEII